VALFSARAMYPKRSWYVDKMLMREEQQLLSILMAVYNERAFIRRCVENILDASLPEGLESELVIVDDCSTDGTFEILQDLAREYPESIRLLRQDRNRGKGAALYRAISAMRGDIAVFQDADLEYDPNEYPRLLAPILGGHADVVYGSRFATSSCRRVLNFHHALGNKLITFLSNLCTGLNLTDIETGYKAFRADILRTIPIRSNRFGVEPEITAKIAKRNCIVYEVPINYHGRTYLEGKKVNWKDGIAALYVILKFKLIDDCYEERLGHAILHELTSARRFTGWLTRLIGPWFGQRILEIGSGIGNISRQLPKRELLTVSDCDEQYIEILTQAFRNYSMVSVARLDVTREEGFDELEGQYDSVVCLNVLEHIQDDVDALRRMATALRDGGHLIVQVPQYRFLMSRLDRELGHLRRYSRREICEKLESAGLSVRHILNVNALGVLGWLVNNRFLRRTTFGKFQLKIYDMLVPFACMIEKLLPHPGLSIVAVAQKPPSD